MPNHNIVGKTHHNHAQLADQDRQPELDECGIMTGIVRNAKRHMYIF